MIVLLLGWELSTERSPIRRMAKPLPGGEADHSEITPGARNARSARRQVVMALIAAIPPVAVGPERRLTRDVAPLVTSQALAILDLPDDTRTNMRTTRALLATALAAVLVAGCRGRRARGTRDEPECPSSGARPTRSSRTCSSR